jgi:polysaccharide deacetylase 2 family uncharacterized protein YibQ
MISAGCSRFERRKPAPRIDAVRVERELRAAVESAAEPQVWIKTSRPAGGPRSPSMTEVVLTPESFDRALGAVRDAAARQGLALRLHPRQSKNGRREVEARFSLGTQFVSRWNLREVERIYRAAIIIDDLGNDPGAAKRLLALPYPLTFSVLPDLEHSARTADEAHAHGREVMLHLPMEPQPGAPAPPGPGEIKVGMTRQEVERILAADLGSVPHVAGVNNHMGSRATADAALMAVVMKVLGRRRLFFVDSRTTAQSAALVAARRAGVPAFYRSVFLDDTETVDYTLGQLRLFRRDIEAQGAAIAIGHPHPTTLAALARFLPELEGDGIELVPASELVRLPEVARLSPPPARRRIEPDTH